MDLRSHAIRELKLTGVDETAGGFVHVMELIDVLLKQSHPDLVTFKAVVAALYQLSNGEPLSPLTGDDDEWDKVSQFQWQNNRCPRVFKELGVGPYDAQGIVFVDEHDRMFTKQPQSRVQIRFPYEPKTKYVKVRTGVPIILPPGTRRTS